MRSDFHHQQKSMADRKFALLHKDEIDKIMDNAEGKNKKRQTVTCCMPVQSAIFYITKIVDSAIFVYAVYHVIWYLPIKF
jgi:hypothetical protein